MNTIDFTKVNPGYECLMNTPFAVIVTSEMMKHLQKICVRRLIMAENLKFQENYERQNMTCLNIANLMR
jgi:hypothetical protein